MYELKKYQAFTAPKDDVRHNNTKIKHTLL